MTDALTPMMQQYRRIRRELPPDVILFFRLGDFYEMFFEDAKVAAPILDVALTQRNKVPMCGVPHHAIETYMAKLIRAGRRVALCEQVEDAAQAKGVVRREVTRVVTPGTITEGNILDSNRNNFLAGVYRDGDVYGLVLLDVSTGLFEGEEMASAELLRDRLAGFAPSECLVAAEQAQDAGLAVALRALPVQKTVREDWIFTYEASHEILIRHFGVHSLEGFGCEGRKAVTGAAGAVLYYVREELHNHTGHIRSFRLRKAADFLLVDETSCVNLDLIPARGRDGGVSLLRILDVTRTAMGARKLREWLLRPLAHAERIRQRHDAVEGLCRDRQRLQDIREILSEVRDLERLVARIGAGSGNARDLVAISRSLDLVPRVRALAQGTPAPLLQQLGEAMVPLPDLVGLITRAIVEDPPIAVKEGGLIREGYDVQVDELRHAATLGRKWLAEYQASEQQRTGIKNLKVRHNRVFGYYIEISKGQLGSVPPDYMRKQTLVNAERFVTPELKDYESRILGAQERGMALEYEIFLQVRQAVADQTGPIQATADAIATLDVLASLAERALAYRYVRPRITDGDLLRIREGRHPVVEQIPDAERFVPNDCLLDGTKNQLLIITGPNMAGKSTFIRQVALIVIMAQMGSFVPAAEVEMGLVDRVFTRVGASDDLARGRSTFLVEMQETANILNNATPRSLIVLDEIGRGTSTFDGISIAWAVAEHLHSTPGVKAKTLFATHYHELADLALTLKGVKNYNVQVREQGDRVVFLRKIQPGSADKSYGIQVARLAGLPPEVIARAREILTNLEEGELAESGQPKIARRHKRPERDSKLQMDLFQ